MLRNSTFAVFAVLALAATAQAGFTGQVTLQVGGLNSPPSGTAFVAPEASGTSNYNNLLTGGNTNWVSYALGLKYDGNGTGTKIGALDFTITSTQPGGGLLQRWLTPDDVNYTTSTPTNATLVNSGDSYFIVGTGGIIVPQTTENRVAKINNADTTTPGFTTVHRGEVGDSSNGAGVRNYAIGTSMRGAFTYSPSNQAAQVPGNVVNFAYIVVPRSYDPAQMVITGVMQATNGAANVGPLLAFTTGNFQFPPLPVPSVPEPSSLTLVGIALAGGLGWRRRRG